MLEGEKEHITIFLSSHLDKSSQVNETYFSSFQYFSQQDTKSRNNQECSAGLIIKITCKQAKKLSLC